MKAPRPEQERSNEDISEQISNHSGKETDEWERGGVERLKEELFERERCKVEYVEEEEHVGWPGEYMEREQPEEKQDDQAKTKQPVVGEKQEDIKYPEWLHAESDISLSSDESESEVVPLPHQLSKKRWVPYSNSTFHVTFRSRYIISFVAAVPGPALSAQQDQAARRRKLDLIRRERIQPCTLVVDRETSYIIVAPTDPISLAAFIFVISSASAIASPAFLSFIPKLILSAVFILGILRLALTSRFLTAPTAQITVNASKCLIISPKK